MIESIDVAALISSYKLTDYEKSVLMQSQDAYKSEPEGESLRIPPNTDMSTFNSLAEKGIMSTSVGRPNIFLSPTGVKLRDLLRREAGLYMPEPKEDD